MGFEKKKKISENYYFSFLLNKLEFPYRDIYITLIDNDNDDE